MNKSSAFAPVRGVVPLRKSKPFSGCNRHRVGGLSMSASVAFKKYHGLGNDFILVDNRAQNEPMLSPGQAATWCDRHLGIGADGVIFLLPPGAATGAQEGSDCAMRIYNSDGSEPEMCGNGIRCLAKFASDVGAVSENQSKFVVDTLAGPIVPQLQAGGLVTVDMGEPLTKPAEEIPVALPSSTNQSPVGPVNGRTWDVTAVSMGNPHAVTFVDNAAEYSSVDKNLEQVGRAVEVFEADGVRFFPSGINVEFVQVQNDGAAARVVVWERGAGRTMACGTGACAVVVAGVLGGKLQRQCKVELPGGVLEIEWDEASNRVFMTGPADFVFGGEKDCVA